MRIALVLDWFVYYGIELANALAYDNEVMLVTRDHSYEVCGANDFSCLRQLLDSCLDKRVARVTLKYRLRDLRNLREFHRIYQIVSAFSPDVIHVQENTDLRILLLSELYGSKRTVLTVHDVDPHLGEANGFRWYVKKIARRRARAVVVHGDHLRTRMLRQNTSMDEGSVFSLPHGVLNLFKRWNTDEVSEEPNTILFFGRLQPYKGLTVLMKALPLISSAVAEVKLIIAGAGELPFNEAISSNSSVLEIHNGYIDYRDIARFFSRAALVVLPYLEASQSGVLALAYAFHKPVVASRVGSISEVLHHGATGFLVPPNEPEDLARAVVKLLSDSRLRKKMKNRIRLHAETALSWSVIASGVSKIYEYVQVS